MNGIGPEDLVGEYISKDRVCRGVINYAGNQGADGWTTMNWFHPPNLLGPASDRAPKRMDVVAEMLSSAGLTTLSVSHHEMKKAAFFKTVLNSALNALCAAHGLTMARAMRLKHTRRMARVLLREGLTVAGLVGYNYGEDALDRCIEYLEGGGEHHPSMWFDLKERRPTEIEFINGKIVKIGHMFQGIDVDHNAFFTSAIVTQEIRNGTRDDDDIPEYLIDS
jgi:2-dehydropantoate 2-reductase